MRRALCASALLTLLPGCLAPLSVSPLAGLEHASVYHPVRYPDGDWQPQGLHYENAWFCAEDGTRLHGWFVPHENPRAVALFAHGNAGNLSYAAESLKILHDRNRLAVMVFDYRGYGRSEGIPSEEGILQDARAARRWLAERTGVAECDILLMGRSLGGGVMVDLAARDGARGLVLASTFTSLPDVARHHVRWLPADVLMENRLDSLAKIGDYHGPLLQTHGDADDVIPYEQGRRLFEAAGAPHPAAVRRFLRIPGGTHYSPMPDEYRRVLDEFIDSLPPPSNVEPVRLPPYNAAF